MEQVGTDPLAAAQLVLADMLTRQGEADPRPRIEPVRRFAQLAGSPQEMFPVIQIAGTNGKTSTSRLIAGLLRAHGLRVGLFTSPHLVDFTERFELDGEPVNGLTLAEVWASLRPALQVVDSELAAAGQGSITFFEALAVLGFALFADTPVEVAVIEVGLGGLWDATNIANADIAVFTPIALDHTAILGNTISEIAKTKAGIIKPISQVVTAQQMPDALQQLHEAAAVFNTEVVQAASQMSVVSHKQAVGGHLLSLKSAFSGAAYNDVLLTLLGEHQVQNAQLALTVVEQFIGRALEQEVVATAFGSASSPGRLQVIAQQPVPVLIDAAHNPHGAQALAVALPQNFSFPDGLCLVLGAFADKDTTQVFEILAPLAQKIIFTPVTSERSLSVTALREHAQQLADQGYEVSVCADAAAAFAAAYEWAREKPGTRGVLVAGSVLLAGAALSYARAEKW